VLRWEENGNHRHHAGRMTKHLIWLLVAALGGSCAPAAAAVTSPSLWQPCADNTTVSCGTLSLPVDWSQPGGQRFDMAVARRPAANPVGTLVYLPAGPGSSGVDAVTNDQIFDALFPPEIAENFDIVGFDPRGVRRSHPVHCDSALVERLSSAPAPRSAPEFATLLDDQAAVGADCRARTGPLVEHLDSVAAARDVDALRDRLGLRQINLYGLSYGTMIGQMYAERFPGRIRTMVLDGVYDHSVDSDRFALTGARAAQESFDQFVAWCDGSPDCALHGTDIRARVAELFTRAEDGDLSGVDSVELSYRIVAPLAQPNLPAVAAVIADLSHPTPEAKLTTALTPLPIYIQCADNVNRTSTFAAAEALRGAVRAVAPDVRGAPYDIADLCINPPTPATNPQRPLRAHDAPPIMVINSRYDPPTPYEGAQRVAGQLDRATLVTYDGMGHGAANRSDCTRGLVLRYFVDTKLPPAGTHCPAVQVSSTRR
jgi:pimeloyl-ACP methyl ester carboxylesterase